MTRSKALVKTSVLLKVRSKYPFGVYTANDFLKKVTQDQKFFMVNVAPGKKPTTVIEEFVFKGLEKYSGPKTQGRDSLICITEDPSGIPKEFIIDELFIGANACFLVSHGEKDLYALNGAKGYEDLIKSTWEDLWKNY